MMIFLILLLERVLIMHGHMYHAKESVREIDMKIREELTATRLIFMLVSYSGVVCHVMCTIIIKAQSRRSIFIYR